MARPTSGKDPLTFQKFGVILGVHPSTNPTLPVELWSSTQSASTASTLWAKRTLAPSTQPSYRYTFERAPSTTLHYFKARHPASPGFSAGSFTPTVSARPVELPLAHPPDMPVLNTLGNVEAPLRNVYLTSAKTILVGTQQTTSVVLKTQNDTHAVFVPRTTATRFRRIEGSVPAGLSVTAAGGATTQQFEASFRFPAGTKIRGCTILGYRRTTGVLVRAVGYYSSGQTDPTSFFTITLPANSTALFPISAGSTLNRTVESSDLYKVVLHLRSTAATTAAADKVGFLGIAWEYSMGNYLAAL